MNPTTSTSSASCQPRRPGRPPASPTAPVGLPNLDALLARRGMSRYRLAGELETSAGIITRWVSCKGDPSLGYVRRLCALLECSADELIALPTPSATAPTTDAA